MKNAILITILIGIPSICSAGRITDGGGGAYVCRGADGKVISSQLVDLWESEVSTFDWPTSGIGTIKIRRDNITPYEQQIQTAIGKLTAVDSAFGELVAQEYAKIIQTINRLPDQVSLTLPKDLQTDYFPTGCPPEGMLRYVGAAHRLDMKGDIFDHLSTRTDIAAAYMHEAIYKILREGDDAAPDSTRVRRLVACMFSDGCIPAPYDSVPKDRTIFMCKSELVDVALYPEAPGVIVPPDQRDLQNYPSQWVIQVLRTERRTYGIPVLLKRFAFVDDVKEAFSTGWFEGFGYHPLKSDMHVSGIWNIDDLRSGPHPTVQRLNSTLSNSKGIVNNTNLFSASFTCERSN